MNPHRITDSLIASGKEETRSFKEAMDHLRHRIQLEYGHDQNFDLKTLFLHADVDGNGIIDEFEFEDLMVSVGLSKLDAATIFRILDPDGDGEVTYGEFAYTFFNRRLHGAGVAKKRQLQPWTPCGGGKSQDEISADRTHAYANCMDPYPVSAKLQWGQAVSIRS